MASGLASAASAAPMTYVLTGDFIGPSQASVAFTWTITGDTTSVTSIQGFPAVPSITDVLNIAGIGSVLPAEQVFVVAADIDNAAAFVDLAGSAGVEWTATELSTWGALTPIGPLNVAFLAAAPLPTNMGDLNVTGGSNLVFTATAGIQVPEPGALWLLLGGIAGLIACSALRARPTPQRASSSGCSITGRGWRLSIRSGFGGACGRAPRLPRLAIPWWCSADGTPTCRLTKACARCSVD
jgi:hypothetical protein